MFNLLGPLTNPCRPQFQVIGVPEPRWCQPIAWVAGQLGVQRAMVVCGHGGVDELVLHGPNQVWLCNQGELSHELLDPSTLGLPTVGLDGLRGGNPEFNAHCAEAILSGGTHPATPAVALNAAALLKTAGLTSTWEEALAISQDLLQSGVVWNKVQSLRQSYSQ
jgi:anthranilate phosphoribosyltransferase